MIAGKLAQRSALCTTLTICVRPSTAQQPMIEDCQSDYKPQALSQKGHTAGQKASLRQSGIATTALWHALLCTRYPNNSVGASMVQQSAKPEVSPLNTQVHTHMDTTPNTPTAAAPVTLVKDVLLVKTFRYTAKKRDLPSHHNCH